VGANAAAAEAAKRKVSCCMVCLQPQFLRCCFAVWLRLAQTCAKTIPALCYSGSVCVERESKTAKPKAKAKAKAKKVKLALPQQTSYP
jgi:hypothetical protein